jgi:myo-inositol-1(or 4)-monophosphatase
MSPSLAELAPLVREAARAELLSRFSDVQRETKADGSLITAADLAMQRRLREALARAWPQIEFLGEEMSAPEHAALLRAAAQRDLWCLDPLDGTTNFAAGVPYFAVSLALLRDGRPELGLVYDPVRDECFSASRGGGAQLNGKPLGARASSGTMLAHAVAGIDFKRLPGTLAAQLATTPPYASQRNFGASSLDWCWVADQRFHIYLHGGQRLWDYAAGCLILEEAGGIATTLQGEAVFTLDMAPRSVLAARDAALHENWSHWIAAHWR